MHSFLQSRCWEQLQEERGHHIWRIQDVLVIRHMTLLGQYLYAPHPFFRDEKHERLFFEEAATLAHKERALFLRIDPCEELHIKTERQHIPTSSMQPSRTVLVDMHKSDHELLSQMHAKMRYNIGLARRAGVTVRQEPASPETLARFLTLLKQTASRHQFTLHPSEHYAALARIQDEYFSNHLFFAYWRNIPLAAALINFYTLSGQATYLHGGSSRSERHLMAPHLLHWEIMRVARLFGLQFYDFWGIDEERWPGLTRFKKSFGGTIKYYPQSYNLMYRPVRYTIYQSARRIAQKMYDTSLVSH